MPFPGLRRRLTKSWPVYVLYDAFRGALAAGAVHGSYATPPANVRSKGNLRTVVDTGNVLSISGGVANVGAGATIGDPGVWYPAQTRVAGLSLLWSVTLARTDKLCRQGFTTVSGGTTQSDGIRWQDTGSLNPVVNGGAVSLTLMAYSANVQYFMALVLRASGWYVFLRTTGSAWALLWHTALGSTATIYPALLGQTAAFTAGSVRVPARLWLPTPLAYETFAGAAGDLNGSSTLAAGPDGQSAPARAWASSAGVWARSGLGTAAGTPAAGAELLTNVGFETAGAGGADVFGTWTETTGGASSVNDDTSVMHSGAHACRLDIDASGSLASVVQYATHVIGTWLLMTGWARASASGKQLAMQYGGSSPQYYNNLDPGTAWTQYVWTLRASEVNGGITYKRLSGASASSSLWWDDVSCVALTLASLFASVTDVATSDVMADATVAALTTGTQAGLAVRLNSATAPTVGIVAYFDGAGNVKVDEFTSATAWTNLISVAKAFTAGDTLRLDVSGTAVRCYHITAAGVATLIGTATATANTNTRHGLFTTHAGNTFSGLTVWPKGSAGEHEGLSAL